MTTRGMVRGALVAGAMCAGAFTAVPLPFTPVPVTLQTCVLVCAALFMSRRECLAGVAAYVLIGLAGIPVFSGGGAGAAALFGRTGGFIAGFLPMAYCISAVSGALRARLGLYAGTVTAAAAGHIVLYAFGSAWFAFLTGTGLAKSAALCVVPFVAGDAVKAAAAVMAYAAVYRAKNYL